MKILPGRIAISATIVLAGCGRSEPRSEEYFHAHLDEARQIVAKCRDGSTRGEECANADYAVQRANADYAVQLAKAETQRDHFFMKDR